jgi:hypothetical protein
LLQRTNAPTRRAEAVCEGRSYTLASDLRVDGTADLRSLPAARTAVSEGRYDVRLESAAAPAGTVSELRFVITRSGTPVNVEPYLGAGGHLVVLREGDLAFLHVHPSDHGDGSHDGGHPSDHGDGSHDGGHHDAVGFEATFPDSGPLPAIPARGRVQTVAYTHEVN